MSLACELSGEPLASTKETVVTTPSGHICIKRLLLQKLAENGGLDPFEASWERPLSEDQLVELKTKLEPVPRPQATSLPNLLELVQTEYDAVILELFDTRKALEDTRRELSQALYQNDAAVRVVARLTMERDAAQEELERWNASVAPTAKTPSAPTTSLTDANAQLEEPEAKRRRVERLQGPLTNDLPVEDTNVLEKTWQKLHTQRKAMLKAAAAGAPTTGELARYARLSSKNWHKSTCRSVMCMASFSGLLATGGKDKQVVVYSPSQEFVKYNFNVKAVPTIVDIRDTLLAVAFNKSQIEVYSIKGDGSSVGKLTVGDTDVVGINLHPSEQYLYIVTAEGRVLVCLIEIEDLRVSIVGEFSAGTEKFKYTCGTMHSDGLLISAGRSDGGVLLWDLKSKSLAATLKDGDQHDAVTTMAFSENGYHLAVGHESALVRFWDLRKQKVIATLNEDQKWLQSITCITFEASARYAGFGGKGGVVVTTVKDWDKTAYIKADTPVLGLAWTAQGIVTCNDRERSVTFYGAP